MLKFNNIDFNYDDNYQDHRDNNFNNDTFTPITSFRLTKEMPILDVASVFIAILSLFITLLIAMGIIGIRQHHLQFHHNNKEKEDLAKVDNYCESENYIKNYSKIDIIEMRMKNIELKQKLLELELELSLYRSLEKVRKK
jgi:hypothetical protein